MTKSRLAITLSRLKQFEKRKVSLEQYETPSEIAADILWNAYMLDDIEGRIIADLGCGNGVFGLGALILGAEKAYFVDIDAKAIEICMENYKILKKEYKLGRAEFIVCKIEDFNERADAVLMNPPFGTKKKHADQEFLLKAFKIGNVVYSLHKAETKEFIEKLAFDNRMSITNYLEYDLGIKASHEFHMKRMEYIKVGCFRFEKPMARRYRQ